MVMMIKILIEDDNTIIRVPYTDNIFSDEDAASFLLLYFGMYYRR
jgi:hypothetical protein